MLALVVAVGGLYAGSRVWRAQAALAEPGHLERATLGALNGPVWVAVESVEMSSGDDERETRWRMSVNDARTGRRLARKLDVPWRACTGAGEGRLWCLTPSSGEVSVVSLPALEELHGAAAVKAAGLEDAWRLETDLQGALLGQTSAGQLVRLDPEGLRVTGRQAAAPPSATGPFASVFTCALAEPGRQGLCRNTPDRPRLDEGPGFFQLRRLDFPGLEDRLVLLARTAAAPMAKGAELIVFDAQLRPSVRNRLLEEQAPLVSTGLTADRSMVVLGFGPPANLTVGVDLLTGAQRLRIEH